VEQATDEQAAVPAYLGLGRINEERGFRERARRLYRQAAGGSRGEVGAEALYRLGVMQLRAGDARGAIAELDRMPTLFGGYTEWMAKGYLEQGRAFEAMGDPGEAVRMYDMVIDFYADRPEATVAASQKERLTGGQQ
jgi:tetratricopeptide (TPR) repeat protein